MSSDKQPRDLLAEPLWRHGDLGAPMPDLPHANSVCLPAWQDVVDYEEKRARVMNRLRAGYPRFVVPPPCARLFEKARGIFCEPGEACHAYPTRAAAERCVERIGAWSGAAARVEPWPAFKLWVVCFPDTAAEAALKYWRHTGDGISSRCAQTLLDGATEPDADAAKTTVRARIASAAGVDPNDVYLFKSGMAALFTLYRALRRMHPGRALVQLGFPYVDTLKILQDFGAPHVFLPKADAADIDRLAAVCDEAPPAGLFGEFPSNPVLTSADLAAVRSLSLQHGFPVIIDDTISTWTNVDLRPVADVVVTSLTKWFTGRGDVMAGSAVLNPQSPFAREFRAAIEAEYEDCTWGESILLAEALSRDADERVRRASATALEVAEWLRAQPGVEAVYYPRFQHRDLYDRYRRPDGGYGGLFSFVLKDPARTSARFYDALELCKGPNLGTTFSLCCPFTLLAHYGELDWAESCGVSRWLLRLSIGQEPAKILIDRLSRALARVGNV
ncbi:MAG TPA: PLP-dependent transferase [Kiritimatiellia bacterium]|nr:PLP-dependent transferase [Kiritimatiellia bacterium]